MVYYGATELTSSFRTVRQNTIQTALDIPARHYGFVPADGARSVARTLVHVAVFPRFQLALHGDGHRTSFDGVDILGLFKQLADEEVQTRSKTEIIELLRTEGDVWAHFLEGTTEEFLGEDFVMPPGATPTTKSRFEMLLSVKEHEMHHRGQLMVAQRLLGIVPHLTKLWQERAAQAESNTDGS